MGVVASLVYRYLCPLCLLVTHTSVVLSCVNVVPHTPVTLGHEHTWDHVLTVPAPRPVPSQRDRWRGGWLLHHKNVWLMNF